MEQEPVVFRATIVDPKADEPPSVPPPPPPTPLESILEEPYVPKPELKPFSSDEPELKPSCCLPEPEHPFERFERQSELGDALPTIFIGIGVAYAIGILTGFVIFSSPSIYLE